VEQEIALVQSTCSPAVHTSDECSPHSRTRCSKPHSSSYQLLGQSQVTSAAASTASTYLKGLLGSVVQSDIDVNSVSGNGSLATVEERKISEGGGNCHGIAAATHATERLYNCVT
jgi:hypothetical protein